MASNPSRLISHYPVIVFLYLLLTLIVECESELLRTPSWRAKSGSTRCGEVLNCSSSSIIYKPFEAVLRNERCVWIIAAPQATSYIVNIRYFGYRPENRYLTIAGFKRHVTSINYHVPTTTGEMTIDESNILVVTFHSFRSDGSSGFILEYMSMEGGSLITANSASTYDIIGTDVLSMKYPSSGSAYLNNELSTLVFPPKNNIFSKYRKRDIVYKRLGLESCWDKLSVFMFNPPLNRWIFNGSICDDVDTKLISGTGIILLIFSTDPSTTGEGFELTLTE